MEGDDGSCLEEVDDEFFDTFFDDGVLETIGRVWNNSSEERSNLEVSHPCPENGIGDNMQIKQKSIQNKSSEESDELTKSTSENKLLDSPKSKRAVEDDLNICTRVNSDCNLDSSTGISGLTDDTILNRCSLIFETSEKEGSENSQSTDNKSDGNDHHSQIIPDNKLGDSCGVYPSLDSDCATKECNSVTSSPSKRGEDCQNGEVDLPVTSPSNEIRGCPVGGTEPNVKQPELKQNSLKSIVKEHGKGEIQNKIHNVKEVELLSEELSCKQRDIDLLSLNEKRSKIQLNLKPRPSTEFNNIPGIVPTSKRNSVILPEGSKLPLLELVNCAAPEKSPTKLSPISSAIPAEIPLIKNTRSKYKDKKKKKKREKDKSPKRRKSVIAEDSVSSKLKEKSDRRSKEKSPNLRKRRKLDTPPRSDHVKRYPSNTRGREIKYKAARERSRSRSGSLTRAPRLSRYEGSRCQELPSSKRDSRVISRSPSKSPVRRYGRRFSRSPQGCFSRTRSRSRSRSPNRPRSSRHRPASPHRLSISPGRPRYRSRSRSPFINEIYRLREKWAKEDQARRECALPPPPGVAADEAPQGTMWHGDLTGSTTTHMLSETFSVSVESVQVHSTSFSVSNAIDALSPLNYMCPTPSMGYQTNGSMVPFCAPPIPPSYLPVCPTEQYPPPLIAAELHQPRPVPPAPACITYHRPLVSPDNCIRPALRVCDITPPRSVCIISSPIVSTPQPDLHAPELRKQLAILKTSIVGQQQGSAQTALKSLTNVNSTDSSAAEPERSSSSRDGEKDLSPDSVKVRPAVRANESQISEGYKLNSAENSMVPNRIEIDDSNKTKLDDPNCLADDDQLSDISEDENLCSDNENPVCTPAAGSDSKGSECHLNSVNSTNGSKGAEEYDSDIIIEETPKRPTPELICISGEEDEGTELYDIADELNKIQKDTLKLQETVESQPSAKPNRRQRKRGRRKDLKHKQLAEKQAQEMINDCNEVIDSLRIGRFFLNDDNDSSKVESAVKNDLLSNSVLWRERLNTSFAFTQPPPPGMAPNLREACSNTQPISCVDVSTSTEDLVQSSKTTVVETDINSCSQCSSKNDLSLQVEKLTIQVEELRKERDNLLLLLECRGTRFTSPNVDEEFGSQHSVGVQSVATSEQSRESSVLPLQDESTPGFISIDAVRSVTSASILLQENMEVESPRKLLCYSRESETEKPVLAFEYHHSSSFPTEVVRLKQLLSDDSGNPRDSR